MKGLHGRSRGSSLGKFYFGRGTRLTVQHGECVGYLLQGNISMKN